MGITNKFNTIHLIESILEPDANSNLTRLIADFDRPAIIYANSNLIIRICSKNSNWLEFAISS